MSNKALSLAMALACCSEAAESSYDGLNKPVRIEGSSKRTEEEKMKAKGMSFWQFRGFNCWALNYKSAMKKYKTFLKKQ